MRRCYHEIPSYALSKVDYSIGENIYMLPGNMNLNIRSGTVGYNNKILISDGNVSLGKNSKVSVLGTIALTAYKETSQQIVNLPLELSVVRLIC